MSRLKAHLIIYLAVVTIFLWSGIVIASTETPIGERPKDDSIKSVQSEQSVIDQSLSQVVHEFGKISLSLDALGTLNTTGTIHVKKPNGATVRKAYLMSATTGGSYVRLNTGDLKLQGNTIAWEKEIPSSIGSYNYWADVTAIIKPVVNAAPAGLVDLEITEVNTYDIDGEILAVIFDDPNQPVNNTVLLNFGALNVSGDSFVLDLGTPIDKNNPNLILDYSLGISYGYQASPYLGQYSTVDVNGRRLTTSAGGQDDGEDANGALITVGGIGDTNSNPADPNATPTDKRSDDELYDLKPFVNNGDTSIKIDTSNPSADDNIFFSALFLGGSRNVSSIPVKIKFTEAETFTDDQKAIYEKIIGYYADAVYESTNGANKIGQVTFYSSSAISNGEANVLWKKECHPNANPSGITTPGLRIEMCNTFGTYNFLIDDTHQRGGGYTLGHEWGHYYYGLYDEYKANENKFYFFTQPRFTDSPVPNSIMNRQWSAIGDHFEWLNFSSAKIDTQNTAQFRVYNASSWDTLTRPQSDDPRDWLRIVLPKRPEYLELAEVKPDKDHEARIDLSATATPRSALQFTWVTSAPSTITATALAASAYNVQLSSLSGQNISYPAPLLLMAFVYTDTNITAMNVQGNVQLPDGSSESVTFTDDGIAPDAQKADGLYSAIYNYKQDGVYAVQVIFDNADGKAKYVYDSVSPAQGPDGPVPMPEPVPITENFTVTKTIKISVSNVKADDYADSPADATLYVANNTPVPGKIDFAGDKDVFQLKTLQSEKTYVRVANLAFGMNPHIRVLGADKSTVLFDAKLDSSHSNYLYIPLNNVLPDTTIYVEVSDVSSTATGGLYEISAGKGLVNEIIAHAFPWPMFLPAITGGRK